MLSIFPPFIGVSNVRRKEEAILLLDLLYVVQYSVIPLFSLKLSLFPYSTEGVGTLLAAVRRGKPLKTPLIATEKKLRVRSIKQCRQTQCCHYHRYYFSGLMSKDSRQDSVLDDGAVLLVSPPVLGPALVLVPEHPVHGEDEHECQVEEAGPPAVQYPDAGAVQAHGGALHQSEQVVGVPGQAPEAARQQVRLARLSASVLVFHSLNQCLVSHLYC